MSNLGGYSGILDEISSLREEYPAARADLEEWYLEMVEVVNSQFSGESDGLEKALLDLRGGYDYWLRDIDEWYGKALEEQEMRLKECISRREEEKVVRSIQKP